MTQYVEGATVYHLIQHLDHKRDHAVARCGEEGQPVEADPDDGELCERCRPDEDDADGE